MSRPFTLNRRLLQACVTSWNRRKNAARGGPLPRLSLLNREGEHSGIVTSEEGHVALIQEDEGRLYMRGCQMNSLGPTGVAPVQFYGVLTGGAPIITWKVYADGDAGVRRTFLKFFDHYLEEIQKRSQSSAYGAHIHDHNSLWEMNLYRRRWARQAGGRWDLFPVDVNPLVFGFATHQEELICLMAMEQDGPLVQVHGSGNHAARLLYRAALTLEAGDE